MNYVSKKKLYIDLGDNNDDDNISNDENNILKDENNISNEDDNYNCNEDDEYISNNELDRKTDECLKNIRNLYKKMSSYPIFKPKKCIIINCNKNAYYNFYTKFKPLYCCLHKTNDMMKFGQRKCSYDLCYKNAYYNNKDEKYALYCYNHRLTSMINVKAKYCKTNLCDTQISNNKYEGYCFYCYVNTFPENNISLNYKTKERHIVDFVKNHFPDFTWRINKKIIDGCSNKRPDLFLDLGFLIIIIEIDENQHAKYNSSCENKRIMELSADVDYRPIVFIRFNPDEYTINNKKISSCWNINKKGFCVINHNKINEWNLRLNKLKDEITFWTDPKNKTDKCIHSVFLFFNS
jgi:hypothetical protein